jgi:ATP adenylyltransferase
MDRLWTPWRFEYISKIDQSGGSCVFCGILAEPHCDSSNFVLFRGAEIFVLLNRFPYTSGHLLIVLNRHIASLSEANTRELHAFLETAQRCEEALRKEYRPEGFNVGFNIGKSAGAGVDQHLHMHVLPRWVGDSSFVSVISETRVLPELLPQTFERLIPHFEDFQ